MYSVTEKAGVEIPTRRLDGALLYDFIVGDRFRDAAGVTWVVTACEPYHPMVIDRVDGTDGHRITLPITLITP